MNTYFFILVTLGTVLTLNCMDSEKLLFNFLKKYNGYKTTNSDNKLLTSLNGSIRLKSLQFANIVINGEVTIGEKFKETDGKEIVVVNGNLNAQHSSFEILEVNGNAQLENCNVTIQGEFWGKVILEKCTIADLKLTGTKFVLKDTIVKGNVKVTSINGRGLLILENTIIKGKIEHDNVYIRYINKRTIENNLE